VGRAAQARTPIETSLESFVMEFSSKQQGWQAQGDERMVPT